MPSRCLWNWQETPKVTDVQHGHQIVPIRIMAGVEACVQVSGALKPDPSAKAL
jgi:hypothetical protein